MNRHSILISSKDHSGSIEIQYRIQKRVGLSIGIAALIVAVFNTILMIASSKYSVLQVIKSPYIVLLFLGSIFSFLSVSRENIFFKLAQVFLFFFYGLAMVVINKPDDITGVHFIVYGILLALQYKMLQKQFYFKIAAVIIFFSATAIVAAVLKVANGVFYGIASSIYAVVLLYLIWMIFAEEINSYIHQNFELKQEIDKNQVFVDFGKNVAGIIHNVKNKITAMHTAIRFASALPEEEIKKCIMLQMKAYTQTMELLDSLLFVVKSHQEIKPQKIVFNQLVKGVADLFFANEDFKNTTRLKLNFGSEISFTASPLEMTQVIENLVWNAWEACRGVKEPEIELTLKQEKENGFFIIKDNGSGIVFCSRCSKNLCLTCPEFKIGRTSKENGNGVGMVFVRQVLVKYSFDLSIHSATGIGTVITIGFGKTA